MQGTLTISMGCVLLWIAPIMRNIGLLIPVIGKFPTTVDFETDAHHSKTLLIRHVKTPKVPIVFISESISRGEEIVDVLGRFCCWRTRYAWDGAHVNLTHMGYAIKLKHRIIYLPLTWLLGRGQAQETPLTIESFAMFVTITHPIWGEYYRYEGIFTYTSKDV